MCPCRVEVETTKTGVDAIPSGGVRQGDITHHAGSLVPCRRAAHPSIRRVGCHACAMGEVERGVTGRSGKPSRRDGEKGEKPFVSFRRDRVTRHPLRKELNLRMLRSPAPPGTKSWTPYAVCMVDGGNNQEECNNPGRLAVSYRPRQTTD